MAHRCYIADEGLDLAGHFANQDYLAHACKADFANEEWSNGIEDESFRFTKSNRSEPNNFCYSDAGSKYNPVCTMPMFDTRESDGKVIYATEATVRSKGKTGGVLDFAKNHGGQLVGGQSFPGDNFFYFILGQVQNRITLVSNFEDEVYEAAEACSTCLADGEISLTIYESIAGAERRIEMDLDVKDENNDPAKTYENTDFTGGGSLSLTSLRNHYIALANNNGTNSGKANSVKVDSIEHGSWLIHDSSEVPALGDDNWLNLTYSNRNNNPAFSALQSDHNNNAVADKDNVLRGDKTANLESSVDDLRSIAVGSTGGSLNVLEASQGETVKMPALITSHNPNGTSYLKYMNHESKIAQRTVFSKIKASTELDSNQQPDYKFIADTATALTLFKAPSYNFKVDVSTSSNDAPINQLTKQGPKLRSVSYNFQELDANTLGWMGSDPFVVSLFMINDSIGTLQWTAPVYEFFRGENGKAVNEEVNIYKQSLIAEEPFDKSVSDGSETGARVDGQHLVNNTTPQLKINLPKFYKGEITDIDGGAKAGTYKFNAIFQVLNSVEHWSNNKNAPADVVIDSYQFRYTVEFEIPSTHYDTDKPKRQRVRRRRRR